MHCVLPRSGKNSVFTGIFTVVFLHSFLLLRVDTTVCPHSILRDSRSFSSVYLKKLRGPSHRHVAAQAVPPQPCAQRGRLAAWVAEPPFLGERGLQLLGTAKPCLGTTCALSLSLSQVSLKWLLFLNTPLLIEYETCD